MREIFTWLSVCTLALFLFAPAAEAKVSAEEAAKLDGELTPMGSIRAGNEDGTIPPWTGGITEPPPGYKVGMHHLDPYGDDKILFTITAKNVDQYKDKLSPGQVAMLKRYPETWRMNVYPTRRSASYPDRIYEAFKKNALTGELSRGGNGVINATETSPFPMPKEGVEVVWNHLLRYRGETITQEYTQAAPTAGGAYSLVTVDQKVLLPFSQPGATIESIGNTSIYFYQVVTSPARLAGQLLLVHETLDQVKEPRKAWTYNPGQRRVRRAPNVAYDNPGTASDNMRTADQLDMYNGAPDRYTWKLVGKKEMYIPYNNYKAQDERIKYEEILQPGHVDPDLLRYELHRAWIVEAKLREGTSHIYGRRVFVVDEDTWSIVVADLYDKRGSIWRIAEYYVFNYYEKKTMLGAFEASYDLQNGRYIAAGMANQTFPYDFSKEYDKTDFTPAALRRGGRR